MNDDFKHQYWPTMSNGTTYNITHVANHLGKLVIQKLLRLSHLRSTNTRWLLLGWLKDVLFLHGGQGGGEGAEIAFPTKKVSDQCSSLLYGQRKRKDDGESSRRKTM